MIILGDDVMDMGKLAQFSYKQFDIYPILENVSMKSFEDGGHTYTLNSSYTVIDYSI